MTLNNAVARRSTSRVTSFLQNAQRCNYATCNRSLHVNRLRLQSTTILTNCHSPLVLPISVALFQPPSTSTLKSSFSSKATSSPCPFRALSIPKNSTYKVAKTSFLKIAMQNHPDTIHQHISKDDKMYDEKIKKSGDIFRKARTAFESLVEDESTGLCLLRIEVEAKEEMEMNNEQFDAWFLNETGHNTPYNFDLDPQTMREVAEAAETMGGGAERDGGMWGLARMIGNTVKDGKEKGNVLKLEAGEIQSDEDLNLEGTLRRRRRGNSRRIIR